MTPTVDLKAEAAQIVAKAACRGFETIDFSTGERGAISCTWPECGCGDAPIKRAQRHIDAYHQFLSEKGMVIVPREPTKAMWEATLGEAGYVTPEAWKAMISAV